jgi:precorrin-2 dehydrogenase / sirohydrochlorin ferrochelatase
MPKPYFALNLDVVGKPCLVIGGDGEALEKSERLLEAQADLLVVAKRASPELVEYLAKFPNAKLELREAVPADIAGRFFVLNCVKTDPALSAWVYEESLKHHAIISAYDQPKLSNAVMMGLVRAGLIRITIASNGASPGLVNAIKKALERLFGTEAFAAFTRSVAEQRECQIEKGRTPKERKHRFNQQLREFDVKGEIVYPTEYLKNLQHGVEQRADGVWWRKDGPKPWWRRLFG